MNDWLWKPGKSDKVSQSHEGAKTENLDFVGARPTTESLLIYRNLTYSPWFALGEFVDNSITSFVKEVRARPGDERFFELRVDISWDENAEKLHIEDNAAGIPANEEGWGRALRVGARNPDPTVLGVYGYGMKAAGLWWSKTMEITSKHYSEDVVRSVTLDPEDLIRTGSDDVPLESSPATNPEDHWTQITLRGLNPGRRYPVGRTLGRVRDFLSSMYRHYLRGTFGLRHPTTGESFVRVFVQEEELNFIEPELLVSVPWSHGGPEKSQGETLWRREFSLEIPLATIEGKKQAAREVSGWVGILSKFSRADAGLFLSFHGKGIFGVAQGTPDSPDQYKPQKLFGTSQSFRYGRLVGEVDVSAFGKSATTDSASWSEADEANFLQALEITLKNTPNLISTAENFRVTSTKQMSQKQAKSHQEDVNQTAAEANTIVEVIGEEQAAAPIEQADPGPGPKENQTITANQTIELQSGHQALFQTSFGKDTDDWLSIYPDPGGVTRIVVNNNHPYIRRHFPVENAGRGVWQLAIALATAELENPKLGELRQELNRWLDLSGQYEFLQPGAPSDE